MKRLLGPALLTVCSFACGLAATTANTSEPPRPEGTPRNFDTEYAEAKLELAQANLQRAESMNQKVSNAVSANVVAEYRQDVEVAKLRLEDAKAGKPDAFAVWLRSAEKKAAAAKTAWESAVAANKRTKGTVEATDVDRLRLRSQVLRLNFERGQSLANEPREAQLEWRVSSLGDEVERLSEVVLRNAPSRSGNQPVWYYYAN
jgi:hypothetical protein